MVLKRKARRTNTILWVVSLKDRPNLETTPDLNSRDCDRSVSVPTSQEQDRSAGGALMGRFIILQKEDAENRQTCRQLGWMFRGEQPVVPVRAARRLAVLHVALWRGEKLKLVPFSLPLGYWSKLNHQVTAGVSPLFHLGYVFLIPPLSLASIWLRICTVYFPCCF